MSYISLKTYQNVKGDPHLLQHLLLKDQKGLDIRKKINQLE